MPLFDALGNTLNTKSWDLHKSFSSGTEIYIVKKVIVEDITSIKTLTT